MATELTVENQDNIYRVHTYPVRIGRAKDNDINKATPTASASPPRGR